MDNLELNDWVRTRVATLDPPADWEPSVAIARGRLEGRRLRLSRMRRYWPVAAAAVVIVCAMIPVIPAFAKPASGSGWYRLDRVWYWFVILRQGPGTIVNLSAISEALKTLHAEALAGLTGATAVPDVAEASRRVGFDARLPRALTNPRVSVLEPASIDLDVRTADIETAMRKMRVQDVDVPANWDGVRIGLKLGPTVLAAWPGHDEWDGFTLAQRPPPVVVAPSGFDVEKFAAVTLRAGARMSMQNASRFARLPNVAAALLIVDAAGNEMQTGALVRQLDLRTGPATLIEMGKPYQGTFGIWRLSLLWSTADRVYALTGTLSAPVKFTFADVVRAWTELAAIANTID